jgi:hypothetical protein
MLTKRAAPTLMLTKTASRVKSRAIVSKLVHQTQTAVVREKQNLIVKATLVADG